MSRCIVNVATGRYVKGQLRMMGAPDSRGMFPTSPALAEKFNVWTNALPEGCPYHAEVPYAFKAYAMKHAAFSGSTTLLWADACIVPGARPLTDLWEKIERDGVWIARNGWTNYEWTADSAYPDLFPVVDSGNGYPTFYLEHARQQNREIPHVVATAFGISLKHPKGRAFLDEYYRLASETKAFCGPWMNANHPNYTGSVADGVRVAGCGPSDVRGHRHDQTAASVIAWLLGVELTSCPEWFSYKGGETDKTCLIADGEY